MKPSDSQVTAIKNGYVSHDMGGGGVGAGFVGMRVWAYLL